MSKKNRNKKKRKLKTIRDPNSGPVFTLVDNPFANVPRDELIKGFVEAGQSFSNEFDDRLKKIQDIINSVDPLHLLSALSVYGLFVGITKDGKTKEKKIPILQSHIELIQALVLRTPTNQLSNHPVIPPKIQEIFDLSAPLGEAFSFKRLVQLEKTKTEKEKAILYLQERLRSHTHLVRNWGFYKNVIASSKRLYEPINSLFEAELGLGATDLIDIFEYLVAKSEKEINQHWKKLKPVFQAKSVNQAVHKYYEAFPYLDGPPEKLINYFKENNASLESVFSVVLSHYDLKLPEICTFSAHSLAEQKGVDPNALLRAFSELSLSFGELEHANPEFLFLGNPVWTKPLIKVEDDIFFCSMPQLFFSFIFKTLNNLIENNKEAKLSCADRRAKFLEDEIFRLMKTNFKDGDYIKNMKWNDLGEKYETDLIYKVDSYLIIIEAKSGAISWPALRGAPSRIERHINELFIAPSRQSQRLASKILKLKSGKEEGDDLLSQMPFDITTVQQIIRISVTLDDFGMIQSNVSSLKSTGWIDDDFVLAPTILLADLEIVFDILESTPEKIHYLVRRAELEEHLNYVGDEFDLLGLYLDTGFNIGEIEFTQKNMMLDGLSKKIYQYYIALDQNIERRKPSFKSTKWWIDIRNHIEMRHPDRWSEVAVMLLNVSFDDQRQAQKSFKKIVKNVKKNWRKEKHINSIVIFPSQWRHEAVAFFAFRERKKGEIHTSMENLASNIFEKNHATRCLIIGVNIDSEQYPYSTLGVFDRPSDD